MNYTKWILLLCAIALCGCKTNTIEKEIHMDQYYFPAEESHHEGTWLTWPHHYTYGVTYRKEIEPIWIQMVSALHTGENVHIIAYDEVERQRISDLLIKESIQMDKINFVIAKSDDVWTRDTGPIFVYDQANKLHIADFHFDGWGKKVDYANDDALSNIIAQETGIPILNIPQLVLEGGAIELDGKGTLMATESALVNRNPKLSKEAIETYLSNYFDVTNFIWLQGVMDQDITDAHIDGMARFYDEHTILTVSEDDFFDLYENLPDSDYEALIHAKNANQKEYSILELPMSKDNVQNLDYKGSYLNYYIGNEVVLLPIYNDEHDKIATNILSDLYKDKRIVPIDVTQLYQYGGMLHCITQQHPQS